MTWSAYFPESVRVQNCWLCDVTVYNGTEKFGLPVTYERSIDECLPQIRAAIATRDAVTLKPPAMIPPGTQIEIPELVAGVVEPPSKAELISQDIRAAMLAELRAQRLAQFSPELQQRIVDAGMEGEI